MKPERLKKIYVYDGTLRLLHALLAFSSIFLIVTGLYATNQPPGSQKIAVWMLHIMAAKVLSCTIILRIIWALVGTKWAMWSELWHWRTWIRFLQDRKYRNHDFKTGHDPYAALVYLGFYTITILMILSGWMLAGIIHGIGPLAEQLFDEVGRQEILQISHEVGFWLVSLFIAVHLAALIYHEKRRGRPIAQGMVSGYQYKRLKIKKKGGQ